MSADPIGELAAAVAPALVSKSDGERAALSELCLSIATGTDRAAALLGYRAAVATLQALREASPVALDARAAAQAAFKPQDRR